MENNPNMESFEKYIKQQSDDFKMYPSKRVWNSVYNNLHPSRKWPSISMCIVLLSALLMTGYLNTKTKRTPIQQTIISQNFKDLNKEKQSLVSGNIKSTANTNLRNEAIAIIDKHSNSTAAFKKPIAENSRTKQSVHHTGELKFINTKSVKHLSKAEFATSNGDNNGQYKQIIPSLIENNFVVESDQNSTDIPSNKISSLEKIDSDDLIEKLSLSDDFNTGKSLLINTTALSALNLNNALSQHLINKPDNATKAERSWIDNYVLYNKQAEKKWKGKLSWQAYFTPSFTYRKLENNAAGKSITNSSLLASFNNIPSINSQVAQAPSLGLESGIGLEYELIKGIKVKVGVQINYTRYNINAFENAHPTVTSLAMNAKNSGQVYELFKSTAYSNKSGLAEIKLHNQTYQLSLPIGAAIKLAAINNIEWYAGSTIQPTYVLAGKSYLISADRKSYVKENSMLNHFNLNAGFETYIAFKTAGGITWQIGPQFRKQLFSTNNELYTIEERLLNYGVKVGISKKF